jgi:hypothetical protein
MKENFRNSWKNILTMRPNSRREYILNGTVWMGGVWFVASSVMTYLDHTLTIWIALLIAFISALGGFIWAWISWWLIGKLGFRNQSK